MSKFTDRLTDVDLPILPGMDKQTSSTPAPTTKSTPLVPASERVKERKKHPFGVPPGEPPPPFTDEVFTTLPPNFLVSVVYAARQEGDEVMKTVESALAAATGPIEAIVVDDASTDGSCDHVEEQNAPGKAVKLIRLSSPVGAGMARNIGFAAARGRVVVSSDAHMRYPAGLWHEVGGFCIEKQAIACPGCAAMFGGPQGWGAQLNYHRDGKIGCSYYRTKGVKPEPTTGVLGACYFLPREIFDELARWPSTMGLWGYEESTLNTWAIMHGYPIFCFPKYTVRHLYRSEAAKGSKVPPWGAPPLSDLHLNHACNHAALFDPITYKSVWKPNYIPFIPGQQRATLEALENGQLYETGHWRKNLVMTDNDFFRDILKVPTLHTDTGAVTAVRPISVILTARNEGAEVARTVRSIINSGQTRFSVTIVDDASTDGSVPLDLADQIRAKVSPWWRDDLSERIKIIRHEKQMGVSYSRAEAIEQCTGDMVFILDSHQRIVDKYAIEQACAYAQDEEGIVVTSVCNLGNTKSKDPKVRDARTYGARFTLKEKWGLLNSHISTRPKEKLVRRDAIIGAGYALSKEVLNKIGGCPVLPGPWAEFEQNVGIRAWILGVPLFCASRLTCEHHYKKGSLPDIPHELTMQNIALTHYIYFGDEAWKCFKKAIVLHGWYPSIDKLLASDNVQAARAMWTQLKIQNGKTDEEFFTEKLKLDWPPTWEPKK